MAIQFEIKCKRCGTMLDLDATSPDGAVRWMGSHVEAHRPDTTNRFMVAGQSGRLVILNMRAVGEGLSLDDALNLAAWLVALSEYDRSELLELLDAIEAT
jgi:hypothetical protein